MTPFDLQSALQNLLAGKAMPAEVAGLREALDDGRIVLAEGERSVAVGGDIRGSIVITGDNVQFELSQEALRLLLAEGYVPLQIPPKAPHFTDRKEELAWLVEELKPGKVVTLTGPGGIGKSALAAEALWALVEDGSLRGFPDGALFHSFYTENKARTALSDFARTYGADLEPGPEKAAMNVLKGRSALLVLDGAESADDLGAVLAVRGGCGALITSRQREDIVEDWEAVPPLEQEDALVLLGAWAGEYVKLGDAAKRVCELVGGLPLAVRLAGFYLARTSTYADEYLNEWLVETPLKALDFGQRQAQSVPLLMEKSLERVSEGAREALAVVGLLALAPFERGLVAAGLELEETDTGRLLGELVDFGMLVRRERRYEVAHALVHTYAGRRLAPPQGALERLAKVLVDLGYEAVESELPELFVPLRAHVETTAETAERAGLADAGGLWNTLGRHLHMEADYVGARAAFERALEIRKNKLGDDHQDTGITLNDLGNLLMDLGDHEGAMTNLESALIIYEKVFGKEHSWVAATINNLGDLLREMGELWKAMEYLERALEIKEKIYAEENTDIAVTVNSLGLVRWQLGDLDEALDHFQHALAIEEASSGKEHPKVAVRVHNLGLALRALDDLPRARENFQQAIGIWEKVYGEEHPHVATGVNSLGIVLHDLGEMDRARDHFQRALAIDEKVYGPEHPNVAMDVNNLGLVLHDMGDLEGSRSSYERLLKIFEKTLPAEHPDLATTMIILGDLLREMGELGEAKEYLERALVIYEVIYGLEHSNVAWDVNNLGMVLHDLGDLDEALEHLELALVVFEKVLGDKHPNVATLVKLRMELQDLKNMEGTGERQTWTRTKFQRSLLLGYPNVRGVRGNLDSLNQ